MKKAFTMIEPIFVIVIVGILTTVVISKINATREDAKLTKVMSEIAVAIQDINVYYISEGKLAIDTKNNRVDFRAMTNAGVIDSSGNLGFFIKDDECFFISSFFNTGHNDENYLGVNIGQNGLCKRLWETSEFKQLGQTMLRSAGETSPYFISFGATRVIF
ncbi:type II secretion system protein [uncultured Campylobacter sp.]|uniref:type II secretion system protein n=1 Tax=uncultured Campylobacter sp. TaxID=218934 RepID=UPI00260F366A|nr:type II secretion system protein [uncultured Campylobacter sp.]